LGLRLELRFSELELELATCRGEAAGATSAKEALRALESAQAGEAIKQEPRAAPNQLGKQGLVREELSKPVSNKDQAHQDDDSGEPETLRN
jgi:hypothetical protein